MARVVATPSAPSPGGRVVFASSLDGFDETFVVVAPNIQTLPILSYVRLDGASIPFPAAATASLVLRLPGRPALLLSSRAWADQLPSEGAP